MPVHVVESKTHEQKKSIVLFYRASCPFSNFYPTKFTVKIDDKDVEFNCSEQYFMYQKALHSGDPKSGEEMLKMTKPLLMKRAGRKLKMDQKMLAEWNSKSSEAMHECCIQKFSQNEELLLALFRAHNMLIAEASPRDKLWGIGLGASNKRAEDPKAWKGANKLGKVLGEVRDELWQNDDFRRIREVVEKENIEKRCAELRKLG